MGKKEKDEKPPFDAGGGPTNRQNTRAARARGLTWSPRRGFFVDEDGCLVRDRFGQPL